MRFPSTVSVSDETFGAVARDVALWMMGEWACKELIPGEESADGLNGRQGEERVAGTTECPTGREVAVGSAPPTPWHA